MSNAIPSVVGRLDYFVEAMKQDQTIKAAELLDAEIDRRANKASILTKQLAAEQKTIEDIKRTRKTLSAYICYCDGMDDAESLYSYPGWRREFDELCIACGRDPEAWFLEYPSDAKAAQEPEPELDERMVLATAVSIFRQRNLHEIADVIANVGHCRGVDTYRIKREN